MAPVGCVIVDLSRLKAELIEQRPKKKISREPQKLFLENIS